MVISEDINKEGEQLRNIFGKKRIVALAGIKNCGKTNNLVALIVDFRKHNTHTPIYIYGVDREVYEYLEKLGNIFLIDELNQFLGKNNALFVVDEFQKLHLNDRRYKDILDALIDLIYHKECNNKIIFCSPNLREFNSIIGSKIEKWLIKSISYDSLVNGSQLKDVVTKYTGYYKQLNDIVVPNNKLLILGDEIGKEVILPYIEDVDGKKEIKDIFSADEKIVEENLSKKNVMELSKDLSKLSPNSDDFFYLKIGDKK